MTVEHTLTAAPKQPQLIAREQHGADEVCLHLRLPADLFWFAGHFAEIPILPGVVQLMWARHFAAEQWPQLSAAIRGSQRLEVVKFQQVIRPASEIKLQLKLLRDKGKVQFSMHAVDAGEQGVAHSSGRLVLTDV